MARSATYFVLLAALALVFVSGSDARTLLGSTLGTYGGFCGYQVSSYMNVSSSDPCAVPMFRDGCRTVFREREWEKSVESTSGSCETIHAVERSPTPHGLAHLQGGSCYRQVYDADITGNVNLRSEETSDACGCLAQVIICSCLCGTVRTWRHVLVRRAQYCDSLSLCAAAAQCFRHASDPHGCQTWVFNPANSKKNHGPGSCTLYGDLSPGFNGAGISQLLAPIPTFPGKGVVSGLVLKTDNNRYIC